MFESRFIVKDDVSFDGIPLRPGVYWVFSELQKQKGRTWHSRPYEYAFIVRDMLRAHWFDMVKLEMVLDLACGANHPGYMAIVNIAEIGTVIALDMDKALLCNGMDNPKVHKIIADATNTGFKDESFDIISCVSAIEHMSNWKDCIGEISRLLKPGGLAFVTVDISTDSKKTLKHNVDDKTPADYANEFKAVGMNILGAYNDPLPHDAVDTICSDYPLAASESELLEGQHNALKTFKMVLKK